MRITNNRIFGLFLVPALLMVLALALCSQAHDITHFPDTIKTEPPDKVLENADVKEDVGKDGGKNDVSGEDKNGDGNKVDDNKVGGDDSDSESDSDDDKKYPLEAKNKERLLDRGYKEHIPEEADREIAPYMELISDTTGISAVTSGVSRSLAVADMRIEVSINNRELYVFSGRDKIATYPVAVGKPEWPTRSGSWAVYEVVWNPWWHPPDEEWAWYRAIMAPGDPDNPLGRAQLIYDAPRSIHGTIEPSSIGRAASHGSIRVTNEVAQKLARQVMESTGIVYDEEWYEEVQRDRSRNVRIRLSERVPIRVYP